MSDTPPLSYDFSTYLDWEIPKLLERLALVASTIAELLSAHAEARSRELEDKAAGWSQSIEQSVRGREKASEFNAVPTTQARIETAALLDGLREEKQFLTFLIETKTKIGVTVSA